ncbi:MAG: ABC transporter ATP-binding protein [Lentisphaeria bacterium]|jgi:branched-chain amino acid transport system ATP-binding protein|nr:ABC transporter ATP-binding protein [Lentisphaeria bacterium]
MSKDAKSEVVLELDNVRSGYGRMEVLRGISLHVCRGEVVCLIGANGAGKSTTLNTVCGLVRVRSGEVRLFGENTADFTRDRLVRNGLSQVPEGRKLFSDMTVQENLELGAYLRKDKDGIARDREHVYSLFPVLRERSHQMAGSLSGGEQQMCAIARALMSRPKILLLDEPSLGLAPILVKQIFQILETLKDEGRTVFLVEQNARMALSMADRGYVLQTGNLVREGPGRELLEDEEVRKAYLGK